MTKRETVHFTVEGEFITRTARSLWNDEGEPEKALNLLRCLQGITEQQCLDVLAGRSKLVGDSDTGIGIEPDNYDGKTLTQLMKQLKAERDTAIDEQADTVQMATNQTVIVASPTGARRIPRRKAIRSGLSEHVGLGLIDDHEFDDLINDEERNEFRKGPKPTKVLRIWRQEADDYGKTLPQPKRFESSMEGIARIATTVEVEAAREAREKAEEEAARERARASLEPQPTITTNTGWLSPEGLFYPCGYSQHARVMWALGFAGHPQAFSAHAPGWIRLGETGGAVYFHDDHDGTDVNGRRPTAAQRLAVRAFCEANDVKKPYWLEDHDAEEKEDP